MKRPFVISAHARVLHDLPWFVAGTLDAERAAETRDHLEKCAACREEHARELRIANLMSSDTIVDLAPQAPLKKLLDRIDSYEARRVSLARLKSWFVAPERRVLMAAVGIQALAIVALAGILVTVIYRSQDVAQYRTLTDKREVGTHSDGPLLRVVFAEDLTMEGLRRLLSGSNARIVDGPGTNGIYTLALASGVLDAEQVAAALRRQPGIRFAEVVSSDPSGHATGVAQP